MLGWYCSDGPPRPVLQPSLHQCLQSLRQHREQRHGAVGADGGRVFVVLEDGDDDGPAPGARDLMLNETAVVEAEEGELAELGESLEHAGVGSWQG